MSAILGVFGAPATVTDAELRSMLDAMLARGAERVETWRDGDVALAVSRFDWELDPAFAGPALIVEDGDLVVAADASMYYRDDLRRALAAHGVVPTGDTPAHLAAAAWRAWGDECAARLEGDFAFVAWDRRSRRALCARDFGGKRPLHYAQVGREVVVASTIGGVSAHPRCPTDLNLPLLAATLGGLHFSAGPETCYASVRVVPQAHHLAWSDGRLAGPTRHWRLPVGATSGTLAHEEAATHLRELLATAVRERLQPHAVNTVWMSGGWDSTAVFGAGQHALRRDGLAARIVPVSISYPEGDPGREDEWIRAIADQWQVPVHWIDIAAIPFLEREEERAAARDEPYAHLYERWNGALAAGSRACGARVALDGNGGDQLFQNSDIFLADLLRAGRLVTLAREWRARPRGGYRAFFATAVQPNLPPALLALAARMRGGRRLRSYVERRMPAWVRPDFAERHALEQRDLAFLPQRNGATHAEREIDWLFTSLFTSRAFALIGSFALRHGIELRSPVSDRRVIEFALTRPWWERSSGTETKRLLRRSMDGLLPAQVLAPRRHRTGITGGYSHRWMVNVFPGILEQVQRQPLVLEELGIVDSGVLRQAAASYPRRGDSDLRVGLYYTLQAELWLRSHTGAAGTGAVSHAARRTFLSQPAEAGV